MAKTTADFILESKNKYGTKFDYSKTIYKNALTNVLLYCTEHDYEFTMLPNAHLKSANGCNKECKLHGEGLKRKTEYERCLKDGETYKKHRCSRCKGEIDDFFKYIHDDCKVKNKIYVEKRKGKNTDNLKHENCTFPLKGGTVCSFTVETGSKYCKRHTEYSKKEVTSDNRCADCGNKRENLEKRLCNKCNKMRNENSQKKRKVEKEEKINKPLETLNKYEISPYYISGFFDGDGSICITEGLSLQIMFSQCVRSVLLKLQTIFGGTIYKRDMSHDPEKRDQFSLRICGKDCEKILKYLFEGTIMKFEQIKVGIKYLNMVKLNDLEDEKIKLKDQMRKLNKLYKTTHNKPYARINWEYIAGIFDAEGCIYLREKRKYDNIIKHVFSYIKITQKNDYKLLDAIRDFTGHGRTHDKTSWVVDRIDFAEYDLNKILPHLIVKKEQAEMCLELFECTDDERRKEIYEVVKFLKKIDNTIIE